MLKIDIHTHILPKIIPPFAQRFAEKGYITLDHSVCCENGKAAFAHMLGDDGSFFRKVQANCWDPEVRLAECDASGIDIQVLSTVPVMFQYGAKGENALVLSQFLNDHLAEVVRDHPQRFMGLGTVPLQDPQLACAELRRCGEELKLQGVQIGSHVGVKNLGHRDFHPFYAEAERAGMAIFVHPWDMMGQETMGDYWLPWLVGMPAESSRAICSMIFGGIFDKFPALKVAFAHGGGSFPATLGRIDHGHQVRPDLCAVDNPHPPRNYCGRFLVDSLVHDRATLKFLLETLGPQSVALGSDYPFPLGEEFPGQLIQSLAEEMGPEVMQMLYADNALRWLGKK